MILQSCKFISKLCNIGTFVSRLKQVYQAPPPSYPLPQCGHIKLAMMREKGKPCVIAAEEMVKHQMEGELESIMASKVPVEKDKIFDSGLFDQERQVILVEGPPGGGKTSLAYYYGQKWASGNLSMFDVVAIVRLRDLAITPANTLTDLLLLACCQAKDSGEIIEMIQQCVDNCPKLLLVLDGWDEAPNDIRKQSYITSILHSITSQSKILITSRPDSSVELHGLANRVEIVGFTEENIHEYFKEALSTELDHDKVEDGCKKLQDHFRSYPVIQSCCSIPLNAAILASLFLSEQSLPSTRHELFLNFVLSCINKKQHDRYYQQDIDLCVSSFDDLPHNLKVQLINLGILAFEGVKQNKVIFMEEDLEQLNLPLDLPGLGVLQIVDRFIAVRGKTTYRYFIYISIQELLAAYLISQLKDGQVKMFEALLDAPRLSAVLQFYAAFTKLTNQGVQDIITWKSFGSKLCLLSFIRCFFEAQIHDDTSLYQQIIPRLLNRRIDLSNVTMTPFDCMSVGYFMASLLRAGGKASLDLSCCSIDDYSLGQLVGEFSRHTSAKACPLGTVQAGDTELNISWISIAQELDISNNNIGDKGIGRIATTLLTNTSLKILNISNCVPTAGSSLQRSYTDGSIHMNGRVHICTALKKNTTLKTLNFACCGISALVAESLARALEVNSSLEELDISYNNIGDKGIGHIATALLTNTCSLKILNISNCVFYMGSNDMNGRVEFFTALQKNTTLKALNFAHCGIMDLVAESLARALDVNGSLQELNIINNNISDNGIAHIAKALEKNNTLKVLHVGMEEYHKFVPFTGLTDTGVLSLAKGIATNTSIEHLSIRWSSTDPDSTLKMMAKSVNKNSSLKTLALAPAVHVTVTDWLSSPEEAQKKWHQRVKVGGDELILLQKDSHLKSLELSLPPPYLCDWSLQFETAVNFVKLARLDKKLSNIHFSFIIS